MILNEAQRLRGYTPLVKNAICLILFVLICLNGAAQKLPTVAVLSTGGTIASKHDPTKGGYTVAFTGEDLLASVRSHFPREPARGQAAHQPRPGECA